MKMKHTRWSVFFCLIFSALMLSPLALAQAESIRIFAAASTTNAVGDIINAYTAETGKAVVPSFASSSTLAKQIDQGAPADMYLSANPKWMDFIEGKDLVEPGTRTNLLGNRITLIQPLSGELDIEISKDMDLAGILGDDKLAMGDPDHVPAGIYGRKALESLGLWESVSPKVARAKDVRAALALVERAEAPLGIVYATDAAISKKIKVVAVFPEHTHPPIIYPACIIKGKANDDAKAFFEFLKSPKAAEIFKTYGFSIR
ncbi:molybdate ABC transporter substrate-binding protein [Desulfobacter vibrioformis]|uniref:molybdate ABC transporter substrate-binding protein n=1 Tax=Desulfobacter vibrioformis TaxID=34031 RepID=UPI00068E3422|nr:molybdate ABC transporter substrate-binding protein [Desulfobacter vibrioformis]